MTTVPDVRFRSVVIVNGLPAAGKSTLAAELSQRTGLAVVSKDLIKETLSGTLHDRLPDVAQASIAVMYALAAASPSLILDSFFTRTQSKDDLLALRKPILEVFCQVAPEIGRRRFLERAQSGHRHEVHDDAADDRRYANWVRTGSTPSGLFPYRIVDTSIPVPTDELDDIVRWLTENGGRP